MLLRARAVRCFILRRWPRIPHRFAIEDGQNAMALLTSDEKSLGILLTYPLLSTNSAPVRRVALGAAPSKGNGVVGFLGAGNYAGRVLILSLIHI